MRSLTAGSGDSTVYPAHPKLRYYGYTVREMHGASAQVIIRHGIVPVATITLAAHESRNDWPEHGGQAAPNGLSVDRVSGNTEISVYFRAP